MVIDTCGPAVIIGESLNAAANRRLSAALREGDLSHMLPIAERQITAGAAILDLHVAGAGIDEKQLLPAAVTLLQQHYDIPLCLDSMNPVALEAALKVIRGRCIINAATGETASLERLLPVAREHRAAIIGITVDEKGVSSDPARRLKIAEKIIERALRAGLKAEDVIIDPVTRPIAAERGAAGVTLETARLIRDRLGVNITLGISDVSAGLSGRGEVNMAFMVAAIMSGVTCPIANAEKVAGMANAAGLIMGLDNHKAAGD